MKKFLSDRILQMAESATIKMSQKARDLRAQGIDIINLSLGEPDFDTPEHIKEAAMQALRDGYTKYTPVPGLLELREAISEKFQSDNDLHYQADEIVVSNGAKQSLANLSLALLNPGDEVIVFAPYWVSYYEIIRLSGAVPVLVQAEIEQDYKVKPEQLEAAISPRTKLVLFSSPCNPTGSAYTREELEQLAAVLEKQPDILVISDEIYEYIRFGGSHHSIGSIESMRQRTITINGMSKGFAMTGWRIGYMGAPRWVAKACAKIQGQFTSGANAFGQKASALALRTDKKPTEEMCKAFHKRRDMVVEQLSQIPGMKVNLPEGAFYSFPDISAFFGKSYGKHHIQNSEDFCSFVLEEGRVASVPGVAFGADHCFRISYAASEEDLQKACSRIAEALQKLS